MRTPTMVLSLLLGLAACDPAPEACEVLPTTFRVMTMNGSQVNGTQINGRYLNGMNLGNGTILSNKMHLEDISFNGTTLTGIGPDLAALDATDFVGARLPAITSDGEVVEIEIAAAHPTPGRPDLTRYVLTLDGQNICPNDEQGLFLAGVWDDTATHRDAIEGHDDFAITFACESGALGKCVDWGYAPWLVGADVHQSCTRMVRADYCGDGDSYTKDGTLIEIGDPIGVQTFVTEPTMEFEAGWGPDGAVCANKPRFYEYVVGDSGPTLPSCWDELPACDSLDEATTHGAKLANRSEDAERLLCSPR